MSDRTEREPSYDEYWAWEIERRLRAIEDGTVEWIPGHKIAAMLDAVIRGESIKEARRHIEPDGE
ncbi:MAG: hypothetical protein ACRDHF_16655 [Tepidiformaceae bacterium]